MGTEQVSFGKLCACFFFSCSGASPTLASSAGVFIYIFCFVCVRGCFSSLPLVNGGQEPKTKQQNTSRSMSNSSDNKSISCRNNIRSNHLHHHHNSGTNIIIAANITTIHWQQIHYQHRHHQRRPPPSTPFPPLHPKRLSKILRRKPACWLYRAIFKTTKSRTSRNPTGQTSKYHALFGQTVGETSYTGPDNISLSSRVFYEYQRIPRRQPPLFPRGRARGGGRGRGTVRSQELRFVWPGSVFTSIFTATVSAPSS